MKRWLVRGLIPQGHIVLVAGQPGNGKSWWVAQLAVDAAEGGKHMCEFDVQECNVIYIDEDTPTNVYEERLSRMHTPHTITPTMPPHFSTKQIVDIIKKVKAKGTEEEKYYFCLATVFAPRRIELCEITSQNFTWNGKTGELVFNPHKHGNTRRHHIPKELIAPLKEYSYKVQRLHTPQLTTKFRYFVTHLDLPVPRLSRSKRKAQMETLREKHQRPRNYGWHAFRHSVTIALSEAGLNDTMISNWMGWRSGNPAAPLVRTYSRGAEQLDAKVQAKHPFIKLWGV